MPDVKAKKAAYVARLVTRVATLLDAADALASLRDEWDALGYGGGDQDAPPETAIVDADLDGTPHLSAAYLNAAVTSLVGLRTILAQGHLTNLQRLRP